MDYKMRSIEAVKTIIDGGGLYKWSYKGWNVEKLYTDEHPRCHTPRV